MFASGSSSNFLFIGSTTTTTVPMSARVLLGNLPFYFRVRIGPEALQLSPPFVLYVPGLMQARRLRLNHRHRQLSTRCTADQEQTIRCCKTGIRLQGLSRPDSSLESLAAIPALANEQCNFRASDLQLLSPAKLYNFRGSRSTAELPPSDSLLTFSFPGSCSCSCDQRFGLLLPGLGTLLR